MKRISGYVWMGISFWFSAVAGAGSLLPENLQQSLITASTGQTVSASVATLAWTAAPPWHLSQLGGGRGGQEPETTRIGRDQVYGDVKSYMEIAPFTAYSMGGRLEDEESEHKVKISDSSSYGLRVAMDYLPYSQVEFLWSHQETELSDRGPLPADTLFDLDIDYYHIGGTILWDEGPWEPFFTGSLGLTRFDPQASGIDSETRFSMGFGGGVRYFPTKQLGLYAGMRGWVTFFNSEWVIRSNEDGTVAQFEADALWQFQVYGGLVIVF